MCNDNCIIIVQFPDVLPDDTAIVVGGGEYPTNNNVTDLVLNSRQFWYDFGIMGVRTLHTAMLFDTGTDLSLTFIRDSTEKTVVAIPSFLGGRPDDRR